MKRVSIVFLFSFVVAWANIFAETSNHSHTIRLRFGYSVLIDNAGLDTQGYNKLKLMKDGKTIFSDTNNQYVKDEIYPLLLHFGLNHDEIFLKFDQGPAKAEVIRLLVKGNIIENTDTLPSFERGACNLAGDGNPRFAAIWDYRQEWDDSLGHRTDYEPIMYYQITTKGLMLDSAMTISVNKSIYGKFFGYNISEKICFPASEIDRRYAKEWKRIKNARKLILNEY